MCLALAVVGRSLGSYHEELQPSPHPQPPTLLPSSPLLPVLASLPQSHTYLPARPLCGPATVWLEVSSARPSSAHQLGSPRSRGEGDLNGRLSGARLMEVTCLLLAKECPLFKA